MSEEHEELWGKLSFTEEEDKGIELGSSSTKVAKEIGKNCAIMKVVTHRSISLDALRKNLRMLWKTNKGVNIFELEEDLFLVEFGDRKDKKKVLDMCPWSYEKQLMLIQDFEGELTSKEIELKWSPFWIQIFNLPLKSRTRETSHALKKCLESSENAQLVEGCLQYRAWLRGEPSRRSLNDPLKHGWEGSQEDRAWAAGVRSEKTIVLSGLSREKIEVGRDHVIKLTSQGGSSSTWEESKLVWLDCEKLGPKSAHWKQLARGPKVDPTHDEIGPINQKHEGPTPLKELDPNGCVQKRRKGMKQTYSTSKEVKERDGGEAMAAMQHCQAP
nr:hypothetical protein CFP56_02017 [Quercus suber]